MCASLSKRDLPDTAHDEDPQSSIQAIKHASKIIELLSSEVARNKTMLRLENTEEIVRQSSRNYDEPLLS